MTTNQNATVAVATSAVAAVCRSGHHRCATKRARVVALRAALLHVTNGDVERGPRGTLTRAIALIEAAHARFVARATRRNYDRDFLSTRKPGNVPARAIRRALERAYDRAGFRGCAEHEVTFRADSPRAESTRSQCRPADASSVRYPKAYAKHGFWVACSAHELASDSTIFSALRAYPPRPGRAVIGRDADGRWVFVRQGRGSGLVVEYRKRMPRV